MAADAAMPILIVDDYRTMARIIRNLLQQLGFVDVDEALSANEALDKLKQRSYGLVISDWNMEPMNGFALLEQIRADQELAKTPFIMVSADSKNEQIVAARKAGASNYLIKPFNAATLKGKLDAVFNA